MMFAELILSQKSDFSKFCNYYSNKNGEYVSPEYLQKSEKVKVFLNKDGNWVAGYCINKNPEFRYLSFLDSYNKKILLKDKGIDESDLVEITCIWMNREVLKHENNRLTVYLSSLEDAVNTNQNVIIGGSKIMSVWKNFEIPLPNELYFGLVPFSDKYEMAKIVYASKDSVYEFIEEQLINVS